MKGGKMEHKVEIFSADCPVCRSTIEMVKSSDCCRDSKIVVHRCEGDECCSPAKNYKIRALPSIVIDGKLAIEGQPSLKDIKDILGSNCSK